MAIKIWQFLYGIVSKISFGYALVLFLISVHCAHQSLCISRRSIFCVHRCSDGVTLCMKVFNETGRWKDASRWCDGYSHSDLFNVRLFEKLFKGSGAYITVLRDIELASMCYHHISL